eukprot:7010929-Ditylum_brightwellii.AAC.1
MIDHGADIKVTMTMDSPSAISSPQDHEDRHIKQEPEDIKPSTTIDKGYYEHSEGIIEDKLNKKDLFNIESIKLKDKEQFSS